MPVRMTPTEVADMMNEYQDTIRELRNELSNFQEQKEAQLAKTRDRYNEKLSKLSASNTEIRKLNLDLTKTIKVLKKDLQEFNKTAEQLAEEERDKLSCRRDIADEYIHSEGVEDLDINCIVEKLVEAKNGFFLIQTLNIRDEMVVEEFLEQFNVTRENNISIINR